jgi:LacI family transcriptional regulator, galactose operon repressor
MSLRSVSELAGVSMSTVSRVLNQRPRVAAGTVQAVMRAVQELNITPIRRSGASASSSDRNRNATLAFLVIGTSGRRSEPAFEHLLRGVSDAVSQMGLSLVFSFVSNPAELPPKITERGVDGLLLHGLRPSAEVQARLQTLPTVWLMGNIQRPLWGDQVLPDNVLIGELAARYLLKRGHRRLAYVGAGRSSWGLEIRSLAFAQAAKDGGANIEVITTPEQTSDDFWRRDGLAQAAHSLAQRLRDLDPKPTGLFIAEDRLVSALDAALPLYGSWNGSGEPHVEIISCNNERPHLVGLHSKPATIDIRAELIGRHGVQRLMWRLQNPTVPERIRAMIEPLLIEPEPQHMHESQAAQFSTAAVAIGS